MIVLKFYELLIKQIIIIKVNLLLFFLIFRKFSVYFRYKPWYCIEELDSHKGKINFHILFGIGNEQNYVELNCSC